MDVPVVTIGGVVFAAIEDSLGGVVQIAVQLEQVTVASRDCPIESVDSAGRSATGGLLHEDLTALFIGHLQYAVEVRRDGAIIEEIRQSQDGPSEVARRSEITLSVQEIGSTHD